MRCTFTMVKSVATLLSEASHLTWVKDVSVSEACSQLTYNTAAHAPLPWYKCPMILSIAAQTCKLPGVQQYKMQARVPFTDGDSKKDQQAAVVNAKCQSSIRILINRQHAPIIGSFRAGTEARNTIPIATEPVVGMMSLSTYSHVDPDTRLDTGGVSVGSNLSPSSSEPYGAPQEPHHTSFHQKKIFRPGRKLEHSRTLLPDVPYFHNDPSQL